MSVISAAAMQAMTDQIAAKMRASLAGYAAESSGKTTPGLADQVATTTGADAVASLYGTFLETDRFGKPDRINTQLAFLFSRADLAADVTALMTYIRSQPGGGFANFSAYASAVGLSIDPLFAELMRARGGDTLRDPTNQNLPVGVFAPGYLAATADGVFAGADGALADLTAAAASGATADLPIFASNNHRVYLRSRSPFTRVVFGLSTLASASIAPTITYWNGNAWVPMPSVTDNSAGLTKNDTIQWPMPGDWEPSYKDQAGNPFPSQERLYTLAIQRTAATVTTPPLGTCISLVGQAIQSAGSPGFHRGVTQPPLALLRLTAPNTISVDDLLTPDMTQFVPVQARFKALTPIGAAVTLTASYNNQASQAQTQAQAAWSSPAALATVNMALVSGDTGITDILPAGWQVAVAAGGLGVIAVEVVPLRSAAV